jgi:hypothetical protein
MSRTRNVNTASSLTRRAKAAHCPADARIALLAAAEWARELDSLDRCGRAGDYVSAMLRKAKAGLAHHLALAEAAIVAAKAVR